MAAAPPPANVDLCGDEESFNPVFSTGTQMFGILVIALFFQLILKPLGQPGPIAQILVSTSLFDPIAFCVFISPSTCLLKCLNKIYV